MNAPMPVATMPPAICVTPKTRRWRYSHGLIRRCGPGRGGDSHHPRRPFRAVLSLGAFIGMPPGGCAAEPRWLFHKWKDGRAFWRHSRTLAQAKRLLLVERATRCRRLITCRYDASEAIRVCEGVVE